MKKSIVIIWGIIITGCLFSQWVFAGQIPLEQILPKNMSGDGWLSEDDPVIAPDEETLSMVINGAAPRFMELGVQRAVFMTYEKGDVYLMLEIYETGSGPDAKAVFKEFETPDSTRELTIGNDSRFTVEMGGTYMAEYIQDRFYVRLSVTQQSEAAKDAILACARSVSDNILTTSSP